MSKYLVIGSNSFSGSHFVNYLINKKQKIIGVSRSKEINSIFLPYKWGDNKKKFKFHQININKQLNLLLKLVKKFKPDYIINFAAQGMVAQSWISPEDWYQTNLLGQVKLHNELRKINSIKKYIHITTPEVYGSTNKWIKENFKFQPSTPYAVSRAACDLHLMSFYKNYNFPVIFTRAANVFGPGQQLFRIIPKAMISARIGKKINLHGGGHSKRSFIYIEDVIDAFIVILNNINKLDNSFHNFEVGTEDSVTIKDFVGLVKKLCNNNTTDLNFGAINYRENEVMNTNTDTDKLKSLGWFPRFSLEDGLKNTIDLEKKLKIE